MDDDKIEVSDIEYQYDQEKKKPLSTKKQLADLAGGLQIASDVGALYGPASIYLSPLAGALGVTKEALNYFDGNQSGYTTLANMSNHIGWGLLGMIPGVKAFKLAKKAAQAEKSVKTLEEAIKTKKAVTASKTSQNTQELDKLWEEWRKADEALTNAKKTKGASIGALKEKAELAKAAYKAAKNSGTISKSDHLKNLMDKIAWMNAVKVPAKSATGIATTYLPLGTMQYAENKEDQWAFRDIGNIGSGIVSNTWDIITDDFGTPGGNVRLLNAALAPHGRFNANKQAKIQQTKLDNANAKIDELNKLRKQQRAAARKKKAKAKKESEAKSSMRSGGKLKYLNDLRQ